MDLQCGPSATDVASGDETALYSVAVSLCGGDRATLLSLASATHRRGVDVLTARLTSPVDGRRRFEATVQGTPRQIRTVEATLRNLVVVTEVDVVPGCGSSSSGKF